MTEEKKNALYRFAQTKFGSFVIGVGTTMAVVLGSLGLIDRESYDAALNLQQVWHTERMEASAEISRLAQEILLSPDANEKYAYFIQGIQRERLVVDTSTLVLFEVMNELLSETQYHAVWNEFSERQWDAIREWEKFRTPPSMSPELQERMKRIDKRNQEQEIANLAALRREADAHFRETTDELDKLNAASQLLRAIWIEIIAIESSIAMLETTGYADKLLQMAVEGAMRQRERVRRMQIAENHDAN